MAQQAFLDRYAEILARMGRHPDKNIINQLTMMAGDVAKGSVKGMQADDLSGLLASNLLRANADCKLPIIYLMDSIMFNVRASYPRIFAQPIVSLFMDTFRSGDDRVKASLKKLLANWAKRRPEHGALPFAVLGELHRKLDPRFDVDRFVREQEERFGRPPPPPPARARALAPPAGLGHAQHPHAPHQQHAQPPHHHHQHAPAGAQPPFGMPAHGQALAPPPPPLPMRAAGAYGGMPHGAAGAPAHLVSQQEYDQRLAQKAAVILDELQTAMSVPAAERMHLGELSQRPELLQQVYDQAREELRAEGVEVRAPTPIPPLAMPLAAAATPPPMAPRHDAATMAEPNWDPSWLVKDASGAEAIARRLYFGACEGGPFADPHTRIQFAAPADVQRLQDGRRALHRCLLDARPTDAVELRSRGWLLAAPEWARGDRQVLVVAGAGFGDDDDDDLDGPPDEAMADKDAAHGGPGAGPGGPEAKPDDPWVPLDEDYPACALTGQEFEKEFDDDLGQWVYKHAVRPDPQGPIYLASAYNDYVARRKRAASGDDAAMPPSPKHARTAP